MSEFFQPPPSSPGPEEIARDRPPPWTGRPQGAPPGVVLTELLLARSQSASVYVAYLDAYPTGFEFEVRATTAGAENASGLDVFGRNWPMAAERRGEIPPELLRIGVQFADGRKATNVNGHYRPTDALAMWPLGGRAGGGRFQQGYWVSPLPPAGPLALLCQWPAAGIPLTRHEVDAQMVHEAADRGRAVFPVEGRVLRDGREWRLGTDAEVAWINDGTSQGTSITYAIPPRFTAYCILELPVTTPPTPPNEEDLPRHEQAVIGLLREHTEAQPWWLGYLDTGASDVVFPYAPRATVYYGYGYVLVEAGPQQAATWRETGWSWTLPELIFPADRSWLVSTMWDDAWTCIGGSEDLVSSVLRHPDLGPRARRIALGQDATPPGHTAL